MTTSTRLTLTLTLPLPPAEAHPNSRTHWAKRARVVHDYRSAVWALVRETLGPPHVWPRFRSATISLEYTFRTKRRRDTDGLVAASKNLVDTLCAPQHATDTTPRLGLLPDDSEQYLTWGTVTSRVGATPGVRVTLDGETG